MSNFFDDIPDDDDSSLSVPFSNIFAPTQTKLTSKTPPKSNLQSANQQNKPRNISKRPIVFGGLLSNLKTKQEKNEFNSAKSITDELIQAQEAQSELTPVDRMIQQQFIRGTISLNNQNNNQENDQNVKKKEKKNQKISSLNRRLKFDWDVSQDLVVDPYSLQSGQLQTALVQTHMGESDGNYPNEVKHDNKRIRLPHQAVSLMDETITSDYNIGSQNNNDRMVMLGMDDDDEVAFHLSPFKNNSNTNATPAQQSTTTTTTQRNPAHNLIANTLGYSRQQQLDQYSINQKRQDSNSNNLVQSLPPDMSLIPRNRQLQNQDKRHWSEKTLDEMTPRDWTILREDHRIITRGTNIPHPLRFWDDLDLYKVPIDLKDAIKAVGYRSPTGIQRIAMPTSLLNRDVIARAQTGSGKTCSFLIPVLTFISKQPALNEKTCQDGPYGIVLAPARELATQIYDEALKLTQFMKNSINIACIIGGKREYSLQNRIELIIATPGRLDELLTERTIVLNNCLYIILDEADKMLDEGFEPQVNRILSCMPSGIESQNNIQQNQYTTQRSNDIINLSTSTTQINEINPNLIYQNKRRRTMLYSATFSSKIEELARKYMSPDYVKVEVGDQEYKINPSITQIIEWCGGGNSGGSGGGSNSDDTKLLLLCKYINQFLAPNNYQNMNNPNPNTTQQHQQHQQQPNKAIIFCARKDNCDSLCQRIADIAKKSNYQRSNRYNFTTQIRPIVLHGDALDREANLRGFKDGDYNVLIATDVAGRGIDVKEVRLVINYELPELTTIITPLNRFNPNLYNSIFEAYTHRVGRTGRAGLSGTAVTFISNHEKNMIPLFKQFLAKNGVKHFPKQFDELAETGNTNKPITL
jgi:superfamily II DNA/RNA helicase